MTDEMTPEQATELADKFIHQYVEKAAELHLKPYVGLISESLQRGMGLVSQAAKADKETAAEILRSVVVLNHAYLEDFLRNIALWLLPAASQETLDEVPLSDCRRAEKFSLGKLAEHRGKTVEELIRESVIAYMDRSTFNNVTEIMSFLEGLDIKVPREDSTPSGIFPQLHVTGDVLAHLESMMKRRHHIVHRADRTQTGVLKEISEAEVLLWLVATLNFTLSIATVNFTQRHSLEEFQKEVGRAVRASDSSTLTGTAEEPQ